MNSERHIAAYRKLKEARKIFIVPHVRPDGDAVSSACAMIEIAEMLGKECLAYAKGMTYNAYSFLPHSEKIVDEKKFNIKNYDLIVVLDCGAMGRTNLSEELSSKTPRQSIIEFDHHPKIDNYSDVEVRNVESASTTEVLYDFIKANKIKFTKNLAACILTGILTDTKNFLYPATTDKTVQIASEMQLYGARFPYISDKTWRNKSLAAMKVWGKAMENLQINQKYNFAFSVLTKEDLNEDEVDKEELESLVEFLSSLYGVKGLLLLKEENGGLKGSLRTSHAQVDISILAQLLGGGGHAKTSGFFLDAKLACKDSKWRAE